MIGRRLRVARAAAGLSLRALEARIDGLVTAQAISKYERDESVPGSGVLIALAEALDVSVDSLTGDPTVVLEATEFRKRAITSRREAAQVEAQVVHRLERYLTVETLLGLRSTEWDRPRGAPYPIRAVEDAEYAARSLRTDWELGADPIRNEVELIEGRGIKVFSIVLTSIDGLAARVRRAGAEAAPVIVVDGSAWGERQRFTLAHELGHVVLDVAPGVDGERAAHRFAGAFLMPAETLRAEVGAHRRSIGWGELFELKRLFGVSVQALAHRCRALGIIDTSLYRWLFREFWRLGWRTPPFREPYAMLGEEPRRLERLCLRGLAEGAISDAKAAELLGVPVRDLIARMEEPPDDGATGAS